LYNQSTEFTLAKKYSQRSQPLAARRPHGALEVFSIQRVNHFPDLATYDYFLFSKKWSWRERHYFGHSEKPRPLRPS